MSKLIRVNSTRAKQLSRFAAENAISVSRAIERMISIFMRAGIIVDRFDELTIDREGDIVRINLAGHDLSPLSVKEGILLARELSEFSLGTLGRIMRRELPGGEAFVVQRAGQSFRFSVQSGQEVVASATFSLPMMLDIVRQFAKATTDNFEEDFRAMA